MNVQATIQKLRQGEMSVEEIAELLNHPYFVLRGNAFLAEKLIPLLSDIAEIMGISIADLAYCCLLDMKSAYAENFANSLPESERQRLIQFKGIWDRTDL